jgi:hypothetical protein
MNNLNRGIKIIQDDNENSYIDVQKASKQSGYSAQYLRKLLRHEKVQAIKIGQLWLIVYQSLREYIEVASTTEDHRYGPRVSWCNILSVNS